MKIAHKFFALALVVGVLCTASLRAYAKVRPPRGCDVILPQRKILTFTAVAEPGSIGAYSPELILKLKKISVDLSNLAKNFNGESADLISLVEGFDSLKTLSEDPRFLSLHFDMVKRVKRFSKEMERNKNQRSEQEANIQKTSKMAAQIWELMVACLFDGKEIYLDSRVADLFKNDFRKLPLKQKEKTSPTYNREIDIAILKKDGSWRWIEVKNWGPLKSVHPESMRRSAEQSQGQNQIRVLLGLPISLELVMRYELPDEEHRFYQEQTAYDSIYFLFR